MREWVKPTIAILAALLATLLAPSQSLADETCSYTIMLRVYNQWTGEHHYTSNMDEYNYLIDQQWTPEGEAWMAPSESDTPVYRLYNPYVKGGDHHYTTSKNEYDSLKTRGWRQEGIAWYSASSEGSPVYRLYKRYATTGTHHYTPDLKEVVSLKRLDWIYEGVAWYGLI